MKDVRKSLPSIQSQFENEIPKEIAYADDIDFVGLIQVDIKEIQSILNAHQLYVNAGKTDITLLTREEDGWKSTKKVGSMIGDKEDVERRKKLSTVAL